MTKSNLKQINRYYTKSCDNVLSFGNGVVLKNWSNKYGSSLIKGHDLSDLWFID